MGTSHNSEGGETPTASTTTLPRLTIPQWLAFAAFAVFCLVVAVGNVLTPAEFTEVRKFAAFLIGALLPSDALIRFGRSLFMRGQQDDPAASTKPTQPTSEMVRATLPQYLAFAVYVLVVVLALFSDDVVRSDEFEEVNTLGVFLVSALLPSEAAIRFGRALYLRKESNVTAEHLRRI